MKLEKILAAGILSIMLLSSCAYTSKKQYEPVKTSIITNIDYYRISEIPKK